MPPRESSVADVAGLVEDGDTVLLDTSRPRAVGQALANRDDLSDVSVYAFGVAYTDPAPLDALAEADGITVSVSMVPPGVRNHLTEGKIEFIPRTLYAVARSPPFTGGDGRTFAVLQTPPIEAETHDLGCLTAYGGALIETADVSVVETNPEIPMIPDGQRISTEAINHVVPVDGSPPVLRGTMSSDTEERIAEHAADLVPDGATVQLGIGKVYPPIARSLSTRDVQVWTGLISNGVEPMADEPSVNLITGCSALGTDQAFYDWIRKEAPEKLRLTSVVNTHSPSRLHEQDSFFAINSAFQVDLYGQVNAEMLGGRQLSGVGGQVDFMHAASASRDGRSVIALPSRSEGGEAAIVPAIGDTGVVTTPRHCVDAVVTEFGVATLQNRNTAERARALCRIAHPGDRPDLERQARELNLL